MAKDLSKFDLLEPEDDDDIEEGDDRYDFELESIVKSKGLHVKAESETELSFSRDSVNPIVKDLPLEPVGDELALINTKAPDLSKFKTEVITLTLKAFDLESEFDDDVFDEAAARDMGEQAKKQGLPVLLASESDEKDHTHKAINTKGIVYDYFMKDGGLYYKAFFPLTTRNRPYVEDILAGLYTKSSIGLFMDMANYICSVCNTSMASKQCPHQPGEYTHDGRKVKAIIKKVARNAEISLVAIPKRIESKVVQMSKEAEPTQEIEKVEENPTNTDVEEPTKSIEIELNLSDSSNNELAGLRAEIDELKSLLKTLLSSPDRINNNNTNVKEVVMEQEVEQPAAEPAQEVQPTEEESKEKATEIKPAVDSPHEVEGPKHAAMHKELTDRLDNVLSVLNTKSEADNQAIELVKSFAESLIAKVDSIATKVDGLVTKANEVKNESFEKALTKSYSNNNVTVHPNQALLERLNIQ